MNLNPLVARSLGIAAAATLAVGLAATSSATASPSPSASVTGDTLTVVGTAGADQIALRLAAGAPNTLQVDFGDDATADASFNRTTFSHIAVFLGNGDDHFRIDQNGGAFADEALVVDAGNGDDTIAGGDGNDVIFGGNGRDFVDGNHGNDSAILGAGEDTATWDPGEGSDSIDGGGGTDTLIFNGSSGPENMTLSANGSRAVFVRDVASIRMDLNDVENLDLAPLGGPDHVTVDDMSGTGFREMNLDLSAQGVGDQQPDVVTLVGTAGADRIKVDTSGAQINARGLAARAQITGSETKDLLEIKGNGGDDSANVGPGLTPLIGVQVDLG